MPCEKHGPRASVTTKTSAFGLGFCLLSPSGHVFHTAWETMIKSYNMFADDLKAHESRASVAMTLSKLSWNILAWTAPSHYLNQCWNIFNLTLRNKLQWNFTWNSNIFIHENILENVVCVISSILSQPQCVNADGVTVDWRYYGICFIVIQKLACRFFITIH